MKESDIDEIKSELAAKGYAVVKDVVTSEDCDKYIKQYREWTSTLFNGDPNRWPSTPTSLVQKYRASHLDATWQVRLKAKPVFASLFGTEKLLSSTDSIAIGRPPEEGKTEFFKPGITWLHIDQSKDRIGNHAYQSGIYLEDADEEDWTLEVMENSHLFHEEFGKVFPNAAVRVKGEDHCRLLEEEIEWYKRQGCRVKRVPVPKGGMVLWDSRTVHANAQPIKGRKHPGRWRYVVFVCMTPAIWASPDDMEKKKKAYHDLRTTTHWPSQRVAVFPEATETDYNTIKELPPVAKSNEARLLCGDLEYSFDDGKPNGPSAPKWTGA